MRDLFKFIITTIGGTLEAAGTTTQALSDAAETITISSREMRNDAWRNSSLTEEEKEQLKKDLNRFKFINE